MPRKDGIAENQSVDENDQNVIHEEEDVREEPDQDPSGDLDEYLNHLPNYNPDDSYIDDEEFGSGINDNANRTVVVDKDTMPGKFTAAKKEKKPAEAGPVGPFEPEKPIYSEIFSNHGEYQHPRTYYRVMYTTLKIFEKAPIKNVDDKIAYCRYLTALELLMDGQAESIRRRFPTYEDQQMEISMGLEEAWKVVHGRNKDGVRNLDRVMGIPLNGSTFGAIAAEKNDLPDYKHFITEAADYIRKRENQPYPGDEAVLEQLPYKYAGNRLFRRWGNRLFGNIPERTALRSRLLLLRIAVLHRTLMGDGIHARQRDQLDLPRKDRRVLCFVDVLFVISEFRKHPLAVGTESAFFDGDSHSGGIPEPLVLL